MMRKLLLLIISIAFLFASCKDSTVDVEENNNSPLQEKIKLLSEGYWIIVSTNGDDDNDASQTKFNSDGSAVMKFYSEGASKASSWAFNSAGDTLTMINQYQTVKYKIETLNSKTLLISKYENGSTTRLEFMKVNKEYKFAIAGKMINNTSTVLSGNTKVSVLWFGDSSSGDYVYMYGNGSVDLLNNTFFIGFENDLPELATFNSNSSDYRLGVGYVILAKSDLAEGFYNDANEDQLETGIIGAIENRAIIMQTGSRTGLTVDDWRYSFDNGWCFGKGVENMGDGHDTWESTGPFDLVMRVDTLDEFEFPNWK